MENEFKLTIHMVASLDGIIAKDDNSVEWFETGGQYDSGVSLSQKEIAAFLKTVDCYVMGSRTYEHALELSKNYGWAYGDTPTIVLTGRELPVERANIALYSGELTTLVNERLKPFYKNVWMVGGAEVSAELLRLKLADEIRLSIVPVILGAGKLFLNQIGAEQVLSLKNSIAYKNGMVELRYEVKR